MPAALVGLAGFAIIRSSLSTASKHGIDHLDALTRLITDGPRLPSALPSPRPEPHQPRITLRAPRPEPSRVALGRAAAQFRPGSAGPRPLHRGPGDRRRQDHRLALAPARKSIASRVRDTRAPWPGPKRVGGAVKKNSGPAAMTGR